MTTATMIQSAIPIDFPEWLAAELTADLASIAEYREHVARVRRIDCMYGGDGRYLDELKSDRSSGGYRRSMLASAASIRKFVATAREMGADASGILRELETKRATGIEG